MPEEEFGEVRYSKSDEDSILNPNKYSFLTKIKQSINDLTHKINFIGSDLSEGKDYHLLGKIKNPTAVLSSTGIIIIALALSLWSSPVQGEVSNQINPNSLSTYDMLTMPNNNLRPTYQCPGGFNLNNHPDVKFDHVLMRFWFLKYQPNPAIPTPSPYNQSTIMNKMTTSIQNFWQGSLMGVTITSENDGEITLPNDLAHYGNTDQAAINDARAIILQNMPDAEVYQNKKVIVHQLVSTQTNGYPAGAQQVYTVYTDGTIQAVGVEYMPIHVASSSNIDDEKSYVHDFGGALGLPEDDIDYSIMDVNSMGLYPLSDLFLTQQSADLLCTQPIQPTSSPTHSSTPTHSPISTPTPTPTSFTNPAGLIHKQFLPIISN